MYFVSISVVVLVLVIIIWWLWGREGFGVCRDCNGYRMPRDGVPVLNPYIWPYSGTACVDDLYILNKDTGVDLNFTRAPLTHLNTTDHVELVN